MRELYPEMGAHLMSDQPNAEQPATGDDGGTENQQPGNEQPKPTETVDFWRSKAREQEKRAKENAKAAERLAEIEDAKKTEAEKAAERIKALETERDAAVTSALRHRIAAQHGIGDEDTELFLTGSDEDTLTKQAQRLAGRDVEQKKNGNYVPREGASPSTASSSNEDERAAVRTLFGGG